MTISIRGGSATPGIRGTLSHARFGAASEATHDDEPAPITALERKALDENFARAQALFTKLGVTAKEGNGKGKEVILNPRWGNAWWFQPDDIFMFGRSTAASHAFFGVALDVVTHELAHRVIITMRPDLYTDPVLASPQATVLHESLADTFAAAADTDDWTIGEDIVPGGARRMDGEAKAATRPVDRTDLSVPNRAAFLIGSAVGREEMAQLYLEAVRRHLRADAMSFTGMRDALLAAATSLHGPESRQAAAVRDAWTAVGLPSKD